jgi:hypothetical protein
MDILALKKPPSPLNYHWEMTARNSAVNRYKQRCCADLIDLMEKFKKYASLQPQYPIG